MNKDNTIKQMKVIEHGEKERGSLYDEDLKVNQKPYKK